MNETESYLNTTETTESVAYYSTSGSNFTEIYLNNTSWYNDSIISSTSTYRNVSNSNYYDLFSTTNGKNNSSKNDLMYPTTASSYYYDNSNNYDLYQLNQQYYSYYISTQIFFIFGTIGNLLVLIVLLQNVFRKTAFGMYASALAIMNLLSLILLMTSVFQLFDNTFLGNYLFCRLYSFFKYWIWQSCSWLQVLISLDSFLSFTFRTRFYFLKSKTFQFTAIFSVLSILFALNLPSVYYATLINTMLTYYCLIPYSYASALSIINLIVFAILPFIIMLVSTLIICIKFFKIRHELLNKPSEHQFIVATISTSFFFLIFNTPLSAFLVYLYYNNIYLTAQNINNLNWTYTILRMFVYLYNSLLFYLNIIFNKQFRDEFINLCKPLCCCSCHKCRGSSYQMNHVELQNQIESNAQSETGV